MASEIKEEEILVKVLGIANCLNITDYNVQHIDQKIIKATIIVGDGVTTQASCLSRYIIYIVRFGRASTL